MRLWMRPIGVLAGMTMLLSLGGCSGGGGGGDDGDAGLDGDAAIEAVAAVIQSTLAVLAIARSEESTLLPASASCASGTVRASCEVENRQSIIRASFDQCRLPLSGGHTAVADGNLRTETNDVAACVTSGISPTATVRFELDDLLDVLIGPDGDELRRLHSNGTDEIVPTGIGCAGRNVLEHFDVTHDAIVNGRFAGRLMAYHADMRFELSDFQLDQTSEGLPCDRLMIANGDMDIDDRANGLRFAQTLVGMRVSLIEAGPDAAVDIDGTLVNDCIGDVAVTTLQRLQIPSAIDCPTGGALRVTTAGRTSEIRFSPQGGLSIDFDADGQPDLVTPSCHDPQLAACSR